MIPTPPTVFQVPDTPEAGLQKWIGSNVDPGRFKEFADARRRDITSGANEPYRSWLFELMVKQSNHLRYWAATRLVEAGAEPIKGIAYPNGIFLDACANRFRRSVIRGNGQRQHDEVVTENPPREWVSLGTVGELDASAPCWSVWRGQLQNVEKPAITFGFYALFSPRLQVSDESWVRKALEAGCETPSDEPWLSLAFLLATDWLMLYGQDQHWKAFEESCTVKPWRKAIEALEKKVRKIPLYWNSTNSQSQGVHPALQGYPKVEPGVFVGPKFIKTPRVTPQYPYKPSSLRLSTDTGVDLLLDDKGKVIAQSLRPGYALGLFGPDALEWVTSWTYEPATLDEKPIPAYIPVTIRFIEMP